MRIAWNDEETRFRTHDPTCRLMFDFKAQFVKFRFQGGGGGQNIPSCLS